MFKITLILGVILFVIGIIVLSILTGLKKINFKIFWVGLISLIVFIAAVCGIANTVVTKQVGLIKNWEATYAVKERKTIESSTIYLKQENGKNIIEKDGYTYYFYIDKNFKFPCSVSDCTFKTFEKTNNPEYKIEHVTIEKVYKFAGNYWFLTESDADIIENLKNKKSPIKGFSQYIWECSKKTDLDYYDSLIIRIPENTLIKEKDDNGVYNYKIPKTNSMKFTTVNNNVF